MSIRGILVGTLVAFALFYLLNGDALGIGSSLIAIWRILFLGFTAASLLAAAIVWRGIPESLQSSTDRPQKDRPVKSDQKWRLSSQLGIVLWNRDPDGLRRRDHQPHSDQISER